MSFTFNSYESLVLPVVAIFAFFGWRRGGWGELGRALVMALAVLLAVNIPDVTISFIERVLATFPRVISVLFNLNLPAFEPGSILGIPGSGRFLLTRIVLFSILAFFAYTYAYPWAYRRTDKGDQYRLPTKPLNFLTGGVLGGFIGLLWAIAINSFLNEFRIFRNDPVLWPEGTTIVVPSVVNLDSVSGLVPTIAVVLVLIVAVLGALRLPNLWKG